MGKLYLAVATLVVGLGLSLAVVGCTNSSGNPGGKMNADKMSGKMSGETKMNADNMSGEHKMSGETKMTADKMATDKMATDKMATDKMATDKMSVEKK